MKKIFIVILALVLFTGCVTTLRKESANMELNSENGYIAGNFFDSKFYLFGFLFGSPYKLIVENAETGKKYSFNFSTKDRVDLYSLPVGSYFVKTISKTDSRQDSSGYTQTTTTYIKVPDALLFDFNIKAGKTTYLGKSRIYGEGFLFFVLDYLDFHYDIDLGKSEIAAKYKNISEKEIISF